MGKINEIIKKITALSLTVCLCIPVCLAKAEEINEVDIENDSFIETEDLEYTEDTLSDEESLSDEAEVNEDNEFYDLLTDEMEDESNGQDIVEENDNGIEENIVSQNNVIELYQKDFDDALNGVETKGLKYEIIDCYGFFRLSDGEYVLRENILLNNTSLYINCKKGCILNMNGKKIVKYVSEDHTFPYDTSKTVDVISLMFGKCTIKGNGTFEIEFDEKMKKRASNFGIISGQKSELYIENGTFKNFVILGNSILTIDGGVFYGDVRNVYDSEYNSDNNENFGKLTINNGTFNESVSGSRVIINNGVFNGEKRCVFVDNSLWGTSYREIEINGGTFNSAVYLYRCNATINGGKFNGGKVDDKSVSYKGEYGLFSLLYNNNKLVINNGEFHGKNDGLEVVLQAGYNNEVEIYGGSFVGDNRYGAYFHGNNGSTYSNITDGNVKIRKGVFRGGVTAIKWRRPYDRFWDDCSICEPAYNSEVDQKEITVKVNGTISTSGIYCAQNYPSIQAGINIQKSNESNVVEYRWVACNNNEPDKWFEISPWTKNNNWMDWTPDKSGGYVFVCYARIVGNEDESQIQASFGTEYHKAIKGICQMPYTGEGGGYLIGIESYDNPNNSYKYEMLILDCNLYVQGKDAWVYDTGKCGAAENCLWTIWQPQYGYYWTLFRIYDANDNLIDEACYGFENVN